MIHLLSSANINTFYQKLAIFVISGNSDKYCVLIHNFIVQSLVKVTVISKKGYDAIILIYDVINNILAHDSNNIVNVVM